MRMISVQTVRSWCSALSTNNSKRGGDLSQKIAGLSYRILRWGKERLPPVIRSLVGVLLMIGGVFGFLPVLGFWMFPLGLAFIALDIPFTAHRIDAWMVTLRKRAKGEDDPQP